MKKFDLEAIKNRLSGKDKSELIAQIVVCLNKMGVKTYNRLNILILVCPLSLQYDSF